MDPLERFGGFRNRFDTVFAMIYNGAMSDWTDKGHGGRDHLDGMDRKPDYVTNEKPEEYWAKQIDPGMIRSKNYSRKIKRTKGIRNTAKWGYWSRGRSGGNGKTNSNSQADKLRARATGG